MNYEFIKAEKKGHVTTVTINRPDVMNSISPLVSVEMDHAFNDFDTDPQQWVCIVTGAGEKAFSAGNDLKFQAVNGPAKMIEIMKGVKGGFAGITSRFDCYKPFIAAVNGLALGGGFEIALACDVIVASEKASFGFPEPRVGLIPGAGGVHRLPRQIPYHLAQYMIMTSKRITAQQAMQYGLVAEIVPLSELISTAEKIAAEILLGAPISIRAAKEATLKGLDVTLQQAISTQFPGQTAMYQSEDFIEGPKAFVEKRPPNWKGR
ncbi:MAG: enoyl-CoA hydratase-related protein [Syntrophobacteraceae bacterium]